MNRCENCKFVEYSNTNILLCHQSDNMQSAIDKYPPFKPCDVGRSTLPQCSQFNLNGDCPHFKEQGSGCAIFFIVILFLVTALMVYTAISSSLR